MKIFYLPLIVLLIACGRDTTTYKISSQEKTLIDNESCRIIHHYPQLEGNYPDSALSLINLLFKNTTEVERRLRGCRALAEEGGDNIGFREVHSRYKVLMASDSLLSLEFKTTVKLDGKAQKPNLYHTLMIDMKDLGFYFPRKLRRDKLWQYIKQFGNYHGTSFNEEAYKRNSDYLISYALKEDSVIAYPGGEGELFGYYRIAVPREKVMDD